MEHFLKHKLLHVPIFVWGLQLLYVAAALGLFAIIWSKIRTNPHRLPIQIAYVVAMIIVDVLWRTALKNT